MKNLISNNAYGTLGLLSNSTQKEISRRIKEIEKLIQIEEIPNYSYDFDYYNNQRTLQNIKIAQQNISTPKLQLLHYFFSIYINNENELKKIEILNSNFNYENIIKHYNKNTKISFLEKKNLAILLSLYLLTNKNTDSIEEIIIKNIEFWKDLIENEKSLKDFQKIYKLDDEIGIDDKLFEDLHNNLFNELVILFSDIANFQENNELLAIFIKAFNLENKTFSINQVEDIYKSIDDSIKILNAMKISEDDIFDDDEKKILKKCLQSFQDDFNKLIELGLFENENTIILRDLVSTTIRIHILDLFNNLAEEEIALQLMKFAIYISGTEGLKQKLNEELNYISTNVETHNILKPIYDEIDKINNDLDKISLYSIEESSQKIKKLVISFMKINSHSLKDKTEWFDSIALNLKSLAVKLHNDYRKFKESQRLINLAFNIAQTEKIKNICYTELIAINKTVATQCGFKGFINSNLGCCFVPILAYGILWLVGITISWIISLFGG